MIISYRWLLEYLPEPIALEALSQILTAIGLEVEALEPVETVKGNLEGLVTGAVVECIKHPNADKLSLTKVDTGTGQLLSIVCGAPNVAAGQKVIVAPVGATVHPTKGEPFLIKKAKIRGEASEGMLCAEDEIGLGESHAGILVLPESTPVGVPARTYFNLPESDTAIHIGLTPNRSDAMSHIGVARDVCAYLSFHHKKDVTALTPKLPDLPAGAPCPVAVVVEDSEGCPRYTGILIEDVTVGASPDWMKQFLAAIGVRSINNVVDITNFVLHEYGQPLHAFDADKIRDRRLVIRKARAGETFVTLDNQIKTLQEQDVLIADSAEGICLAGIYGGLNSGVTAATRNIFLESAYFDGGRIRSASLRLGLRTDAAQHFEKQVDMAQVVPALRRAAGLLERHAGGELRTMMVDVYPAQRELRKVDCRYDFIRRLCGQDFSDKDIRDILTALHFKIEENGSDAFTAVVPSNKADVHQPADLAEEVLRIGGLDNVPLPGSMRISLNGESDKSYHLQDKIAGLLCGLGFHEIVTNSVVNSAWFPDRDDLVKMINSLSSELDIMRPSLLESGLEVVSYNCNRQQQDLRLFEWGSVYHKDGTHYEQRAELGIWITGSTQAASWQGAARPADLYTLKSVAAQLFAFTGTGEVAATVAEDGTVEWRSGNRVLAAAMTVPEERLRLFGIKQPVYFLRIDWQAWHHELSAKRIRFAPVPKFPAVKRDLAIVVPRTVAFGAVDNLTRSLKLPALRHFDLFDVFESDKLGEGKKSFAISYDFQLADRTLTDEDVEQHMSAISEAYRTQLNAQIRD